MNDKTKNDTEHHNHQKRITDTFEFIPQDITLKDDAFHTSKGLHFTEWWYFDAALNDGYSIQFSTLILNALKISFLIFRVDIYKEGHLIFHTRKVHLLGDVEISKEKPFIKIGENTVIQGSRDETTGNLLYDAIISVEGLTADLHFTGTTKGWKGKHEAGDCWAVVLPRATVNGTITFHQQTIAVQGSGYHDHNWNVKIYQLQNIGWYWGKIFSNRTAITWANILRTTEIAQPLLVINPIHKGYINIPSKNFQFIATDISEENGKMIPHTFTIDAHTPTVTLNVTMKTIDIHHVRLFLIMDYWRYHVRCTGTITVESDTESIDDLYIAEFLKFP